jgi:hypothetical protein
MKSIRPPQQNTEYVRHVSESVTAARPGAPSAAPSPPAAPSPASSPAAGRGLRRCCRMGPANGDSKGEGDSHPAPAATCTRRKIAAAAWSPIRLPLLEKRGV